jgi:hypothetical protein
LREAEMWWLYGVPNTYIDDDDVEGVATEVTNGLDVVAFVDDNAVFPGEDVSDFLLGVQFFHDGLDVAQLGGGEEDQLVQLRHLEEEGVQAEPLDDVEGGKRVAHHHLYLQVVLLQLLEAGEDDGLVEVEHEGRELRGGLGEFGQQGHLAGFAPPQLLQDL